MFSLKYLWFFIKKHIYREFCRLVKITNYEKPRKLLQKKQRFLNELDKIYELIAIEKIQLLKMIAGA